MRAPGALIAFEGTRCGTLILAADPVLYGLSGTNEGGNVTIGLTRINKGQKVTITLRDATVGATATATAADASEFGVTTPQHQTALEPAVTKITGGAFAAVPGSGKISLRPTVRRRMLLSPD